MKPTISRGKSESGGYRYLAHRKDRSARIFRTPVGLIECDIRCMTPDNGQFLMVHLTKTIEEGKLWLDLVYPTGSPWIDLPRTP